MIKDLIPKLCPNCNQKLSIQDGVGDGIIKLCCINTTCSGSVIKKLEKGIKILEINRIGPAVIKKLYNVGIRNCIDLFDKSIVNEDSLIESGEFKKGRSLEIVLNSISNIKEIDIIKAINSMQLEVQKDDDIDRDISIGKSLSAEIGKMISNVPFNFEGLSIQIRTELENPQNSSLYQEILNNLKIYEDNGIKIKYISDNKQSIQPTKTLTKKVSFDTKENKDNFLNLGWKEVNIEYSDILIVDDKNQISDKINKAKENGIKILTYKQAKLLFL